MKNNNSYIITSRPKTKSVLKEYSEGYRKKAFEKFKKTFPNLTRQMLDPYLDRFKEIGSYLTPSDPFAYKTFSDFENTINIYDAKNTKHSYGKLEIDKEDANRIYDKNGIQIYEALDKSACIKYSTGYTFCIGARGDNNMYMQYRRMGEGSTVYFVVNTNLTFQKVSDRDTETNFLEPYHLCVIHVFNKPNSKSQKFMVTNANNNEETHYSSFEQLNRFIKKQWNNEYELPREFAEMIKEIPLGIKDYYEDIIVLRNKVIISSGNLSGLGLTKLPDIKGAILRGELTPTKTKVKV
jgi:hypothetical protein